MAFLLKERLNSLMSENYLTKNQLAHDCKLSNYCVNCLLKGSINSFQKQLIYIACYFHVSIEYLLGFSTDKQGKETLTLNNLEQFILDDIKKHLNLDIPLRNEYLNTSLRTR